MVLRKVAWERVASYARSSAVASLTLLIIVQSALSRIDSDITMNGNPQMDT